MHGVFCLVLFGVFLHFSGGQRIEASRRVFRRPELGRRPLTADLLAGAPDFNPHDQQSALDPTHIQQANRLRLRNFRARSGLSTNSRTSTNLRAAENSKNSRGFLNRNDNLINSRGFPNSNDNLANSRGAFSRSNTRVNTRSRNGFHDNTAASGSNSFSRNSHVDHRRLTSTDKVQNDLTSTRHASNVAAQDFRSDFRVTPIGNGIGNQGLTQDQQLVREMQLLNSLLSESGNTHHSDASSRRSSNQNAGTNDFGSVSLQGQNNPHNTLEQPAMTHDFSSLTQQHPGFQSQPKIVLLRNKNPTKPLNLQIGNTRLEVLGGQQDSGSQLIIKTLQNAMGTPETINGNSNTIPIQNNAANNQNGNSAINIQSGNSAMNIPNGNAFVGNTQSKAQQTATLNSSQNGLDANILMELLKQLQSTSSTSTNSVTNNSAATSVIHGQINVNNAQVPMVTTAAPIPMATTPLTPSEALRQILGPGVPNALLKQMANDILPSELQRIDAIMTGQVQIQSESANPAIDKTNVGILKIGNQTHAFDVGTTKKIKIKQDKHGPRAEVTSIIGGNGISRHGYVTEEPPEYDEILLRKVLQKMSGR